MTEHKQWLNSLEVGTRVAVKNRPTGSYLSPEMGWRIYCVKYITPKRTRFDLTTQENGLGLSVATRDMRDMQPVTPEIFESIARDNNCIRARNTASRLVATLQAAINYNQNALNESGVYESMTQLLQSLPKLKE